MGSGALKKEAQQAAMAAGAQRKVRLVCLSDTHGQHRRVEVPDGDILVHAGDLTQFGQPTEAMLALLEDVDDWFGGLPHRHKVVIAGNHDRVFVDAPAEARARLHHATYLQNSGVVLEGLRFWGSPNTPVRREMAFAVEFGEESRALWRQVPAGTDVLVTHGPPFGTGDQKQPGDPQHWGLLDLTETVLRLRPALHVFGHIHGGYGQETNRAGTRFVNCSVTGAGRVLRNPPVVVDLPVL